MISDIIGLSPFLPCSRRSNAFRVYWSGMVDQLNFGPW